MTHDLHTCQPEHLCRGKSLRGTARAVGLLRCFRPLLVLLSVVGGLSSSSPARAEQPLLPDPAWEQSVAQGDDLHLPKSLEFYSVNARAELIRRQYPDATPTGSRESARRWEAFGASLAPFRAQPPFRGVAYLVAGWSNDAGFLPPGDANVYRWLGEHGFEVRLCWWNSLRPAPGETPGPIPEPFTDRDFVRQLTSELTRPKLNGQRVVLIGHSFGGNAVLEVASEVAKSKTNPRRIDFLGVLDAVGPFGLRSLARRHPVPTNVAVFWNRWQRDSVAPFDFQNSGRITVKDPVVTRQDQQRARTVHGLLAHQRIFESADVQAELIHALDAASATW